MSKKMGIVVVVYGLILASVAFVLQQIAPALAKVTFVAGLVAGGLSVIWGIVALLGYKRRAWAVLTLIPTAFVLLTQVVQAWTASVSETPGKLAGALMLTVLMLLTMGMLIYLLHGERPPEFYRTGNVGRNNAPGGIGPSGRRRDP